MYSSGQQHPQFNPVHGPMYTTQPGAPQHAMTTFVPMPAPIEGVPPGLEYLTMVDTIVVHQIYELIELLTDWESKNKYALKNANGEQVYYAAEKSECCERLMCGNQRGFAIHIVDNFRREVIRVNRPFKCCACGCCCLAGFDPCAQECTIESPPGTVIGSVKQIMQFCIPSFIVRNGNGEEVFQVDGPCYCETIGCVDIEFRIKSMNGAEIGVINRKFACFRTAFTDADVFKVTFPLDLEVKMKALLLGATFLIDFMMFERNQQHSSN